MDQESNSSTKKDSVKVNPVLRLIQHHYRTTPPRTLTPSQLKSESVLVPEIPFNRWLTLPAAIIIQFCCGSFYCWSVFNKPIDTLIYGENRDMTPITFYITVGFFGFSAATMGPWLERNGPRRACFLGTFFILLGHIVTSLALHFKFISLVFIGSGILSGFGYGLSYISPISAIQKWFPDKRGLASGFATCGFGMGSIGVSKVIIPLISGVGLPLTFVVLGSCYFVLMIAAGLVLRVPPPGFQIKSVGDAEMTLPVTLEVIPAVTKTDPTLISCLTSRTFLLMYIMLFSNVLFGLVVISRFSNMITDIFHRSSEEATTDVSINGACNLLGRLVFSILSDHIGRKNSFVIMLTSQLVILGSFSTITSTETYWAFLLTMWILTACYGAGFGVIPAFLSDVFGSSNIGACHGIILTAWSIAGVGGGLIFTAVFNHIKNWRDDPAFAYNVNVWWIFGVVIVGWCSLWWVQPTQKDLVVKNKLKKFVCCCR